MEQEQLDMIRQENWKTYEAVAMTTAAELRQHGQRIDAAHEKISDMLIEAARLVWLGQSVPAHLELKIAHWSVEAKRARQLYAESARRADKISELFLELNLSREVWTDQRVNSFLLDRVGICEADIRSHAGDLRELVRMIERVENRLPFESRVGGEG